jgi:cytochrome c553
MPRMLKNSFCSILLAGLVIPASGQTGFKFFNPAIRDSIPKLISGTGMYKSMAAKEISANVTPFEVNAPLWTDGAIKQRYVAVPAGTSVIYDDTADSYAYPDRAMVIKNFSVDTIPGNPASRILFETRFSGVRIVAGKEKWYLWSYHWRLDQTDADLVVDSGENATVRVYRNGTAQQPFMKKWRFPGVAQCAACHRVQGTGGRTVLAFFTAQLNKPLSAEPTVNQLTRLFDLGILKMKSGARPDFSKSPRWAHWDDATASLELRARSYIAANCSGCHGTRGIATNAALGVTLDYDFHDMKPHMDFVTKKLTGVFPIDSAGLIVPGRPDRSVLIYRQKMRNQKDLDFTAERMAMPPLGSFEPDTNAINVISQWVTSLGVSALHGAPVAAAPERYRVRGGLLEALGPEAADAAISLRAVDGGRVPLTRLQPGLYRIEGDMPHGIHFLVIDGRLSQRIVF